MTHCGYLVMVSCDESDKLTETVREITCELGFYAEKYYHIDMHGCQFYDRVVTA